MRTYKMKHWGYRILAGIFCAAVFAGTSRGAEFAGPHGDAAISQNKVVETGVKSSPEEEGGLYITRSLATEELEHLEAPSETYWTQDGREYELSRWEIKEIPGHRAARTMEKQIVYAGVEGAEGLPESITVADEVTGVPAEGELSLRKTRVLKEEWQEGFTVPVTFHSYGADEYEAGSLILSGKDPLTYTDQLGSELLNMAGLSPGEYRIHTIDWVGEPYADEAGQICRQALAMGEKLLRDYEVTYEGEVSWMEPVSYELGMVYRPAALIPLQTPSVEAPPEPALHSIPPADTELENSPLWYWVRSGFVITVAAGLIGIFAGMALLLILRSRQRKERKGLHGTE